MNIFNYGLTLIIMINTVVYRNVYTFGYDYFLLLKIILFNLQPPPPPRDRVSL